MLTLLRVYGECLIKTPRSILKNPWTIVLPMGYGAAWSVATLIVAPMGLVGGFILGFVEAALIGSALYFIDEMVAGNPVKPEELVLSLRRYLWPVVNVLFIFWIAQMLVGPMLGSAANGGVIYEGLMLVLAILLNATPEVIYQKRFYGGLDTLAGSVRFIQENWIEWFIANVALFAPIWFFWPLVPYSLLPALGGWGFSLVAGLVQGLVLLPVMIFRGHLFHMLDTTSARQRKFRYRNA